MLKNPRFSYFFIWSSKFRFNKFPFSFSQIQEHIFNIFKPNIMSIEYPSKCVNYGDNTNMLKWILCKYHLVFMKDVKP